MTDTPYSSIPTKQLQVLSTIALVTSVTNYGDVAVNLPIIHSVGKSVGPRPINIDSIGRFDPVRSIFTDAGYGAPVRPHGRTDTDGKREPKKKVTIDIITTI